MILEKHEFSQANPVCSCSSLRVSVKVKYKPRRKRLHLFTVPCWGKWRWHTALWAWCFSQNSTRDSPCIFHKVITCLPLNISSIIRQSPFLKTLYGFLRLRHLGIYLVSYCRICVVVLGRKSVTQLKPHHAMLKDEVGMNSSLCQV